LFEGLLNSLREQVTQQLSRIRPVTKEEQEEMMRQMLAAQQSARVQTDSSQQAAPSQPAVAPVHATAAAAEQVRVPILAGFDGSDPTTWGNPGRNDICPCGSGEKFKHCHGRLV
jgi:preprotein translocase subunit SecA